MKLYASDINKLAEAQGVKLELLDCIPAVLHQESENAYWWRDDNGHDYSKQLGIYENEEAAEKALIAYFVEDDA
jgi:hypothetical protein